ncbi:TetR/AcrR family transcriptional regulator [Streptomyces sp. NPDC093252]|uniref:TetR/AcrR family transcriptional regulator n=1 Tax=Streptomyces sp. NPDC093252 TaxID=3154980 RepID=UPI0034138647
MTDPREAAAATDAAAADAPVRRRRRSTGSYAAADARRAAIIETATGLFADQGFHRTTLGEVARATGVSQTGLLHHFKTKDSLLLAVLSARDRQEMRHFGPPTNGLRAHLAHILDVLTEEAATPALTRLFLTTAGEATAPEHPAHDYFRRRYTLMCENNARAVTASMTAGEVRQDTDPQAVGRTLVAVTDGLKLQWLLSPTFDLVTETRLHFDALLRGLATERGAR